MEVIDCHCHIYPGKIADRAVHAVGDFYGIHMDAEDGTSAGWLGLCQDTPISKCFAYSVATRPDQVESINDFIAAECEEHPEFIGFMTLHQDYPDPEKEIGRAMGMGLKGIKLHPDTQQVDMDDDRLMAIYEIAQGELPLVIHTGDYRYDFSHPRRLKKILKAFPDLVVNAAHFGGWSIFDYGYELLRDENCFVDTSSAQAFLGPLRTKELCSLYGADRVMFGSDFPMWSPKEELDMLLATGLSDEELEKILYGNAMRFLGV